MAQLKESGTEWVGTTEKKWKLSHKKRKMEIGGKSLNKVTRVTSIESDSVWGSIARRCRIEFIQQKAEPAGDEWKKSVKKCRKTKTETELLPIHSATGVLSVSDRYRTLSDDFS